GIFPQVHYISIHLHPYYRKLFGYRPGDFPNAERFYKEEISLPLFVDLPLSDVKRIVKKIKQVV
ncbi:MAG: DegT/DnrJ/EryC1/StrS family aminotransferase, partial [Patescibacteria group bacterium]